MVGHFDFRCLDDNEAELACEDMADRSAKVLWCGERRIRDWPATLAEPRRPAGPKRPSYA